MDVGRRDRVTHAGAWLLGAWLVAACGGGLLAGCGGGPSSRLVTRRPPTGSGPVALAIVNASDTPVNELHMARTDAVDAAMRERVEPGSPAESDLWGADLLGGSALERGGRFVVPKAEPGRWDVRALDRDRREQRITGLRLGAGGRYVLEIHEGGWRAPR